MQKLRIDVWSDIACPWCFVGKRRLEAALAQFPHRDAVEVFWRAFELDPAAPLERSGEGSYAARIASKYGKPVAEAEKMIAQMTETARRDGLSFRFDRIRPGNTFDAHRVVHLAGERGVQDAVKERFLRGYLEEGELIGDPATLVRLGAEAGLDAAEVQAVVSSNAHAAAVRADESLAQELGIHGVPFFVLDRKHALSGAQPAELFLQGLTQVWKEVSARPEAVAEMAEGAACGPDGCG
jgi:predicted DsbA family dithiol-disulfide isomerase